MTLGKSFKSVKEIFKFVDQSVKLSWSPSIFLQPPKDGRATERLTLKSLQNLAKLSGIKLPDSQIKQEKLMEALNNQIIFLDHLHGVPDGKRIDNVQGVSNESRLLNHNPQGLTYDELIKSIKDVSADVEKGEVPGCWNPIGLAKVKQDGFYIVKGE